MNSLPFIGLRHKFLKAPSVTAGAKQQIKTLLPIGRRLLLRIKSSRSRTVLPSPRGAKLLQRLKPSTQGRDKRMMAAMLQRTAFLRVQPVKSVAKEMMFWNTAIMVEKAAKDINRKKQCPPDSAACHMVKHIGQGNENQGRP